MTLRSSDLKSDSDLDCICNSCDFYVALDDILLLVTMSPERGNRRAFFLDPPTPPTNACYKSITDTLRRTDKSISSSLRVTSYTIKGIGGEIYLFTDDSLDR